MRVLGVNNFHNPAALPGGGAAVEGGGLDRDAFLQLLIAQMRHQDPLGGGEGQDPSAFVTQLALLTIIEQVMRVAQTLEESGEQQWQVQALDFLDRSVVITTGEGEVSGTVSAVRQGAEGVLLTVNGEEHPLHAVRTIYGRDHGG